MLCAHAHHHSGRRACQETMAASSKHEKPVKQLGKLVFSLLCDSSPSGPGKDLILSLHTLEPSCVVWKKKLRFQHVLLALCTTFPSSFVSFTPSQFHDDDYNSPVLTLSLSLFSLLSLSTPPLLQAGCGSAGSCWAYSPAFPTSSSSCAPRGTRHIVMVSWS